MSLLNVNRFSDFFDQHFWQKISNNVVTEYATTLQLRRYTTVVN